MLKIIPGSRRAILVGLALLALASAAHAEPGHVQGGPRQVIAPRPELLAAFARSLGLAAEHLAWANGRSPSDSLHGGEVLTIPARILPPNPPTNGAIVNLAERGMYLFKDGEYQGFFPLAIGMSDNPDYETPVGNFLVQSRIKDPEWIAPDSDWAKAMDKERIPGGDASNPLGHYWFGINHPAGGYGFHENTNPLYTGSTVSHGCMRLYPEHAKQIYDQELLRPGTTVQIINRSIRLGKTDGGELQIAVFPSTYGGPAGLEQLRTRLEAEDLRALVPPNRLELLSRSATGIPTNLLGPSEAITINGAVKSSWI